MLKVIGGYLTGEKSSEINGKLVEWDNVVLNCITDDIPDDKLAGGFFGVHAEEIKLKRKTVKMIGFNDWSELVGKEIAVIYSLYQGKPVAKAVEIIDPKTK